MTEKVVYKAKEIDSVSDGQYEFCASDESVDSYGDVVRADGWELTRYKKNPIVLFQHQNSVPVGISTRVWQDGKKLMARIKLAAEGTSPFIDTLRKLLEQKIIRAVSVGFLPLEEKYIRDESNDRVTGYEFIRQELLEISLVSVPANPNALSQAKSLSIPSMHLERVFPDMRKDASVFLKNKAAELEIIRARRYGHK